MDEIKKSKYENIFSICVDVKNNNIVVSANPKDYIEIKQWLKSIGIDDKLVSIHGQTAPINFSAPIGNTNNVSYDSSIQF